MIIDLQLLILFDGVCAGDYFLQQIRHFFSGRVVASSFLLLFDSGAMKNMPLSTNNSWYFDKKELKSTPSIQDGLDYDTELRSVNGRQKIGSIRKKKFNAGLQEPFLPPFSSRYRREGARLILDIGNKMGLRFDTIWTGVIYFHRFYMFRSFKDFKRYVTATCCLFLGK